MTARAASSANGSSPSRPSPVAITAYALANSLGNDTSEVLGRVFAGEARFTAPTLFQLPFTTLVGQMFDLPAPHELDSRFDSRLVRIAMLGARQLHADVTRAVARHGARRVAFVLGSSTGGMAETERAYPQLREGSVPAGYDHDHQHPLAAASEALGSYFGIHGPRLVVSTACSSSGKALGTARRLLRANLADAVVVGGVDSLCRLTLFGFHSLGVLSERATRPFCKDRDGITLGEGAAFVLLDRHAEADVYFAGIGESSDAHHLSSPDPDGVGVRAAIEAALTDAQLAPTEIGHVNAHGTGTLQNDAVEGRALTSTFGHAVPVTSTKSTVGHLLGAGGLTEAVVAAASLLRGEIPPTAGDGTLDPELGLAVVRARIPNPAGAVLSNSFGFGGSNVSVVLAHAGSLAR